MTHELDGINLELADALNLSNRERALVSLGGTLTGVESGVLSTTDSKVIQEATEARLEVKQIGSVTFVELKPQV